MFEKDEICKNCCKNEKCKIKEIYDKNRWKNPLFKVKRENVIECSFFNMPEEDDLSFFRKLNKLLK